MRYRILLALTAIATLGAALSDTSDRKLHTDVKSDKPPFVMELPEIAIVADAARPDAIDADAARGESWSPTPCDSRAECLARIFCHEADCLSVPDEHLIVHVLTRVGGGRLTLGAMRAYSSRATGTRPPGTARTRWIAQLDRFGRRPADYASTTPWPRYLQERWLPALERAQRYLASPPPAPSCELRADHWGGKNIDDRTDDGWFESQCEGTHNRGWCDPALGSCVRSGRAGAS